MTFAELANKGILTQPVYEPGKPIEQVARELGLDPAGIVKMASNENPFGPSPKAVAAAGGWNQATGTDSARDTAPGEPSGRTVTS